MSKRNSSPSYRWAIARQAYEDGDELWNTLNLTEHLKRMYELIMKCSRLELNE
ncbi:hypothetical protein [Bacillus sp. AFS018417]|uniref:hypothetical protein n=1 Tax=Bacillus sp. AFS018417 TaxID=2033491 RepID=UPI001596F769|nr:hypothetical protein [Bacillus sp. AFS018417]